MNHLYLQIVRTVSVSTFLLSERFFLVTDRILYRDPQPAIIQQKSKLHVSIGFLPMEIMESGRTGGIQIIGLEGMEDIRITHQNQLKRAHMGSQKLKSQSAG